MGGGGTTHLLLDGLGNAGEGLLQQRLAHRLLRLIGVGRGLKENEEKKNKKMQQDFAFFRERRRGGVS